MKNPVQELTLYHARILMNVRYPLHYVQKVKYAVTLKDPMNVCHPPGQKRTRIEVFFMDHLLSHHQRPCPFLFRFLDQSVNIS